MEGEFKIKNEDANRLVIDLLIKTIAESQALKELILFQIAASASSAHRSTALQDIQNGLPARVKVLEGVLKDEIWKQYGHLDLEGL